MTKPMHVNFAPVKFWLIAACTLLSPLILQSAVEWKQTEELFPPFPESQPRPDFLGVVHEDGLFYLRTSEGRKYTFEGAHYPDTHEGYYFSTDGIDWIGGLPENPSREVPWLDWREFPAQEVKGEGVQIRLAVDAWADGYPRDGTAVVALTKDGVHWSLLRTDLPEFSRLAGYINGYWVAVRRMSLDVDVYASTDGIHWQIVDWPKLNASEVYFYTIYYGSGAILIIGSTEAGSTAISTTDVVNWKSVPLTAASDGGACFSSYSSPEILRLGDSYLLQSSCVVAHPPRSGPILQRETVLTGDFETFSILSREHYPLEASDGSTQVRILEEDSKSIIETTTGAGDVVRLFDTPEIHTKFIDSFAELGGLSFMATPSEVYLSRDAGVSWETSLSGEGYGQWGTVYEHLGYGFHDLQLWDDTVWVIADPKDRFNSNYNQGGLWRWEAATEDWISERSLPGNECLYLFTAGNRLCLSGFRNGEAFVETTTDGTTWEAYPIGPDVVHFSISFVQDRFWLSAFTYPSEVTVGKLYYSFDLEEWVPVLEAEGFGFGNVSHTGGDFIVSRAYAPKPGWRYPTRNLFSEVWLSGDGSDWTWHNLDNVKISGMFTQLPDGGILDWGGRVSSDGIRWEGITGYPYNLQVAATVTASGELAVIGHLLESDYDSYGYRRSTYVINNWVVQGYPLENPDEVIVPAWFESESLGLLYYLPQAGPTFWLWSPDLGWIWVGWIGEEHWYLFIHDRNEWVLTDSTIPGWFRKLSSSEWQSMPGNKGRIELIPVGAGIPAVYIPEGDFLMGTQRLEWQAHPDEKPVHWEAVGAGFWFATVEVTQEAFQDVMGYNPAEASFVGRSKPVVLVTKDEAVTFCETLTERGRADGWLDPTYTISLPTEAEWEYAVTREIAEKSFTPYTTDIAWFKLDNFANARTFDERRPPSWGGKYDSPGTLAPVRQYPAISREFPIYDAMGNVWEWCLNDYYLYDPQGDYPPASHEAVANGYHTARGGGWSSDDSDLRTSNRTALPPDFKSDSVGFRIIIRK